MPTRNPRIAELFDYLDKQHEKLLTTIAVVPDGDRHTRPSTGGWSIAEVVEHLAVLERRLVPLFERLIAEARAAGLGAETDTSPILPKFDPTRFLNRARKIETAEATRPTGNVRLPDGVR